ncbi:hypothetical protein Tsubulata_005464 [Turnera subulata]|uniref:Fe2OG dioxygenase domain-containing protein n=1 Tax=Turnera subulata TaxID=218843 RepID=A0A9Q0JCL4_9ROSI|nr:hypothetical protein Tsubulata_005464 [Turnera subulata]
MLLQIHPGPNFCRRSTIEAFARTAATLAQSIAEILALHLGVKTRFFAENCAASSSYLRMNRYPPCPLSSLVYGIVPHTDSDFLTILHQDQIGGLQFKKNGSWLSLRPNPDALIISIGDLFQVIFNQMELQSDARLAYNLSIEHRVAAPREVERFTVAYFYCPSDDAVVQSCGKPAMYRKFSFREYRQQIQKDVEATGDKVGLSRFLI